MDPSAARISYLTDKLLKFNVQRMNITRYASQSAVILTNLSGVQDAITDARIQIDTNKENYANSTDVHNLLSNLDEVIKVLKDHIDNALHLV